MNSENFPFGCSRQISFTLLPLETQHNAWQVLVKLYLRFSGSRCLMLSKSLSADISDFDRDFGR